MDSMTKADVAVSQETRRMELRGIVRLAGEVVAQYWPMRTFVHHNPLHSLEYLPFDETVRRGRVFLGGQGYLSGETYRGYLRSGRIRLHHLNEAVQPVARDEAVVVGPCRISHWEVLRACLTHGLCEMPEEPVDTLSAQDAADAAVQELAERLAPCMHAPTIDARIAAAVRDDTAALGRSLTLSAWCDKTLGTQIVPVVNNELIKWCEAFLDEGHATWPMPGRERGFYAAWKSLAAREWLPCGIRDSARKIAALPEHPEDAVLQSLEMLGIPDHLRQDYLALQLTALPGWAGFIKWRAEQQTYPWQLAYPVSLVKFLAVRLWYVRELVGNACREAAGIAGDYQSVMAYMQAHPEAYFLRTEHAAGRLPTSYGTEIARLANAQREGWRALADRLQRDTGSQRDHLLRRHGARRLLRLAQALEIVPSVLLDAAPEHLAVLLEWMDAFPASAHGPVWLRAFEAGYHEQLFGLLMRSAPSDLDSAGVTPAMRPQSQSVYCLDVRSEPFRRHLESTGANETYGFAGFFAVFIRYRAWGHDHETEQYPVIMRARNEVREIPRSYFQHVVSKHAARAKWLHAGHTLLHDLKENVVTPYVMVESLGWFYALPIVGKTAWPALYQRVAAWIRRLVVPPLATSLTVDKLAPADIDEMLIAEQRAVIWRMLREQFGMRGGRIRPDFVEAVRLQALSGGPVSGSLAAAAASAGLDGSRLDAFLDVLRREYRLNPRSASRQKERITRAGFTLDEQVLTVETALRMMGLTRNFARVVLFCAHGSTSENNPFESALDCGACGGNEGKPNARVLAVMANNPRVRERLAKNGLEIPSDTHFLAGQFDTATDAVELFDLEDVPLTHRKDVARLLEDLQEAARLTSLERCARFPDVAGPVTPGKAAAIVRDRGADWSQVRPEWGLSGNTSFVIGRRELTKGLNLQGRVFLHSYDYREDPTGRLLEVLLTGPQVVAQWINMEHYFSTVDNEVYGSGSKIYHNVVGRIGIMSGPWSDLRLGLAWQTVMNGPLPYHEPLRLLTVVEAPHEKIDALIARHEILQHFYRNEWVHLAAVDPDKGGLYRYHPSGMWNRITAVFAPSLRHEDMKGEPS